MVRGKGEVRGYKVKGKVNISKRYNIWGSVGIQVWGCERLDFSVTFPSHIRHISMRVKETGVSRETGCNNYCI